ncbi:MAG TPA: TetR/AcrR family transcriptional regulator [Bauldia sp.]|nr:TetR/AcrR family transcriptional regulator [Bauldia sp.]
MPYTAEHKQQTRTRIIESARRLFNRNGFEAVSIGEIMSDAGLTHGGFYKHFAAKEDLYQAAVLQFICGDGPEQWQAKHIDPNAKGEALARMIVDAYLSRDHYDDLDGSCPLIAFPSDVARGNGTVKDAFRQVMEMMVGAFEANLPKGKRPARERALALVSMVVGGMVLARSVGDEDLADEIRATTRRQVYDAAGWQL